MLSARPPYGTTVSPAVSSMDELQLAQHVCSNVSGPVGDAAASLIRVFKISGRVLMEMQDYHLEIVSQGDPNVMQVYLKLQGRTLTGRLRERRHSIADIYPELGSEFPSIRGHSRTYQSPSQFLNIPILSDGLIGPYSAPNQVLWDTSPVVQAAGRMLAFDDGPVVNPIVQLRHHHAESESGHITDESVGLGILSEYLEVEGVVVVTSRPGLYEISSLSPLSQQNELFVLDRGAHSPHNPPTPVASERHTVDDLFSEQVITPASAAAARISTQPGTYSFGYNNHTSPQKDDGVGAAAAPSMSFRRMSIQGGDHSVEVTSHSGSNIPRQNASAAQPIKELLGHTLDPTPREQDVPSATASIQAALNVRNEPLNQGTNDVRVDERSSILSCPSLDETPSVTEAICLELSGPSGARVIHICDPVSNATCNLFPSDLRTEDPCPLDLSAVVVANDSEKRVSQNILFTPRASSADPVGKYKSASLPLEMGGITIGSPKHSNSTSLIPGAISSAPPIASTSPAYFQDQLVPLLSPDPPHGQIICNTENVYKVDTGATWRTQTPLLFDHPATYSPHVGLPLLHATEGGFYPHLQVLATSPALSRVGSPDPDFKTAAQGYHGMVSHPPPDFEINSDNVNSSRDVGCSPNLSLRLSLSDSTETASSLEVESKMDDQLSDHTPRMFDIDYVTPGLLPDGPSTRNIVINALDKQTSTKGAYNPGGIDEDDPTPFGLNDLRYDATSETRTTVVVQSTNSLISSSVSESSGHEDEVHRPDGPLPRLLPIVSSLPGLEYWYSPTDTRESCQLWKNIFGQAHTSCWEARTGPMTEIIPCHLISAASSLYRQDTLYEITAQVRGDVPIGSRKFHESDPTSNSPLRSAHCTPLLQLDLPKSSLIEDISAISSLLSLPGKAPENSLSSSAIGSDNNLRSPCAPTQPTFFPISWSL